MATDNWMTTREAAAYCNVSTTYIIQAAHSGKLPHGGTMGKVKARYRFQRADLDEWMKAGARTSTQEGNGGDQPE